jgi:hypothetical protein
MTMYRVLSRKLARTSALPPRAAHTHTHVDLRSERQPMESVRASVRASFIGTALQVDLPAVGGAELEPRELAARVQRCLLHRLVRRVKHDGMRVSVCERMCGGW